MVETAAATTTGLTKPLADFTRGELENLNEAELEAVITAAHGNANEARLVLGRLLIEGTNLDAFIYFRVRRCGDDSACRRRHARLGQERGRRQIVRQKGPRQRHG